jgi:hypothetical protein
MNQVIDKTIDVFVDCSKMVASSADRDLISRQIDFLRDIKDSLPKYGTMRHKLSTFEKLISDPWMEDSIVYNNLYTAWSEFKESYKKEVSGMTVNERLCHMGLMDEFDACHSSPAKMRSVLAAVFLSPDNIEAIIKGR